MNYIVEILPQALDNIESAYRWMADNFSPERAEQWYEELMIAVQSLERFPNRRVSILHVRHSSQSWLSQSE
jgi:plasmid stabilization system protein ParE